MTKIAINVNQLNRKITLPLIFSKKLNFVQNFLVLIDYLTTLSIGLMLLFLPVSMYFNLEVNGDTSTFVYFIAFSLFILTLNLIQIVLAGNSRIVDPKGIFQVLIFALLITITSVLVSPTGEYQTTYTANTFGSTGAAAVKSLSGLAVIGYVSFVYFLNLFIRKNSHINIFMDLMSLGFIFHTIVLLLNPGFDINQFILVISTLWLLYRTLTTNLNSLLLKAIYIITIIVNVFIFIDRTPEIDSSLIFVITFSLFVGLLPILITHIRNSKKYYLTYFQNTINSLNALLISFNKPERSKAAALSRFLKNLTINLLLIAPFILLIIFVLIAVFEENLFIVSKFKDDFIYVYDILKTDIAMSLVGLGSGHATVTTSYFNNVFLSHGLIGLGAYLFIWIYPVYKSIKFLKSENQKKTIDLVSFLLVIQIFIPILGLFVYPGMFIILTWWIVTTLAFIVTSKMQTTNSVEGRNFYEINYVGKNFIKNIFINKVTTLVIIVSLVILCGIFINGLFENIGNFI